MILIPDRTHRQVVGATLFPGGGARFNRVYPRPRAAPIDSPALAAVDRRRLGRPAALGRLGVAWGAPPAASSEAAAAVAARHGDVAWAQRSDGRPAAVAWRRATSGLCVCVHMRERIQSKCVRQ